MLRIDLDRLGVCCDYVAVSIEGGSWTRYDAKNFGFWRNGGLFDRFVTATAGSIDCLSIHL